MAIQAEINFWYSPWPGHISLKLYDPTEPEIGYYISSEYRENLQKCLSSGATMDYEQFFMQELQFYGKDCIKLKLPIIPADLGILKENANLFEQKYSLKSNNCAHISARILHLLNYIHNPKIEKLQYLYPKELYTFMVAQAIDSKPVNDLEYCYSLIKSDLRQLDAMATSLQGRGYKDASTAAKLLISNINQELMNFALEKNKTIEGWKKVQEAISALIKDADPILSEHRGMKQVLGNILLSVLMLGVIYAIAILIKGLTTGNYLFFHDTKTSEVAARISTNANKVTNIVPIEEKKDIKEVKVAKHVNFDENCYVIPIDFESKQRPKII